MKSILKFSPLNIKLGLFFALAVLCLFTARATHIRAGEIVARRIDNNSLTFEFIFVGFRDNGSNVQFGGGDFDFGDGTVISSNFEVREEQVTSTISRVEFRLVHTYQAPATYIVSYREEFRNGGISNMANSVNTAFYVSTTIAIDPIFGINNTPQLTVPPIDDGLSGVSFIHNPGAFDPDGDSLSYELVIPLQAKDVEVTDYRFPNDPEFYTSFATGNEATQGPPTFRIDPVTGDLIWDSPGDVFNLTGIECPEGSTECAEYNVAFVVKEWRNILGTPRLLGSVTRDMQIIISNGNNEKPELQVPEPICVEAGTLIEETIIGSDPDGHPVRLEAFGGPFEVPSPATYTPFAPPPSLPRFQASPGSLEFRWETVCGHVQNAPYAIQFKVSDNPVRLIAGDSIITGPTLVDFEAWEITVVGPAPQGLATLPSSGRAIQLDWEDYECSNAESIQVWRRVGDFAFEGDECLVGIPDGSGYELIGQQDARITSFLDNDNGDGLDPGAKYCYRLVAIFPLPNGGISYASEEVCLTLLSDSPVITNVDIQTTDEQGSVMVQWTPPYEVDPTQFPPPYAYEVYRLDNFGFEGQPELVASNLSDTFFIDTEVNTLSRPVSYRIALFDGANNFVDSSAHASSVRLELEPGLNAIQVNWSAQVPWSNNLPEYPLHFVYRDNVLASDLTQLVIIDTVRVAEQGFTYFDDGSFNATPLDEEIDYCYFVTAQGGYDNPILPAPLINRSQIQCARPSDIIPPCVPLSLQISDGLACEELVASQTCVFNDFQNEISWINDPAEACDDDVVSYNVYFSSTGNEEDYEIVASVNEPNFLHEGLPSYKGCYRVSAVDRSGNESELTEELCNDNCPNFVLPNVFTPNSDGRNDVFTPLFSSPANPISGFDNSQCPRFITGVQFTLFDRTGKTIFEYNSDESEAGILINWNGKTEEGRDVPSGTYFYSAEVELDVLASSARTERLNGWLQILR